MNHKRQSSSGSFNTDHYSSSFSSLENFMIVSKLMQDEIMVPSKLKDKIFESKETDKNGSNGNGQKDTLPSDVLDHYRFILLIRSQLTQTNPFKNGEEYSKTELKNKKFKTKFDSMKYHYTELMGLLDNLSNEAKMVTDIYKENV